MAAVFHARADTGVAASLDPFPEAWVQNGMCLTSQCLLTGGGSSKVHDADSGSHPGSLGNREGHRMQVLSLLQELQCCPVGPIGKEKQS